MVWPIPGTEGRDWVINATVDLDPSPVRLRDELGTRDNSALTYDQHDGLDIDIPSFTAMDRGVGVLSAAAGEVIETHDGEFDRDMIPPGHCMEALHPWNLIRIRQTHGEVALYGHLRKSSLRVKVGDQVQPGQIIAQVGSSGCSAQPHLHFQLKDCEGRQTPTLKASLWRNQPKIILPLDAMDVVVHSTSRSKQQSMPALLANGISDSAVSLNERVLIVASTAGGTTGDRFGIELLDPLGALKWHKEWPLKLAGLQHRYWLAAPDSPLQKLGTWKVRSVINGQPSIETNVEVH